MNVSELYNRRNIIQNVPHLKIDPYYVDYSREERDHSIILRLCIIYKVKTLELDPRYGGHANFLIQQFDQDLGESEDMPFVQSIRHMICDVDNNHWYGIYNLIFKHSAVHHIEFRSRTEIGTCRWLNNLFEKVPKKNFNLRKITLWDTVTSSITGLDKRKTKLDNLMKRNRNLFMKKQATASILLGISKFRKLPGALCKDVMRPIARTVFYTDPVQVLILLSKVKDQNSITF